MENTQTDAIETAQAAAVTPPPYPCPEAEETNASPAPEAAEAQAPAAEGVEMYQSAGIEAARRRQEEEIAGGNAPVPFHSFLENIRPGFWD